VAASQGHLDIVWVIVVAAAAAIIGDNIGYVIGRKGGTKLLARWAWTRRMRDKYMPPTQRFFNAHGGKTIFLRALRRGPARLRRVDRRDHAHALVALLRLERGGWDLLGRPRRPGRVLPRHAAADAIQKWGLIGAGVAVAVGILLFLGVHYLSKRVVREED
jgi:hypothetical protein